MKRFLLVVAINYNRLLMVLASLHTLLLFGGVFWANSVSEGEGLSIFRLFLVVILILTLNVLYVLMQVYVNSSMKTRRHYDFCVLVAALNCVSVVGLISGTAMLMLLFNDSIKNEFASAKNTVATGKV